MSGRTAGIRMNKTPEEGTALLNNFFSRFSKVKEAIDLSKKSLKDNNYVEDWAGRRRHLPVYSLPNYEFKLTDVEERLINFNPFIGCINRTTVDKRIIKWQNKLNAEIESYQAWRKKMAEESGESFTPNGEISQKTLDKLSKEALKDGVLIIANTGRKAKAERECFNARIQGGAASLTKLAMVNIVRNEELKALNAKLVATIHDEVLVECPEENAARVEQLLPQIMIDTAGQYINIPMACDPYNVTRWYADTVAAAVQGEFKALTKGDPKKGIAPISREAAIVKVAADHIEIPKEAIIKTIETGEDLAF